MIWNVDPVFFTLPIFGRAIRYYGALYVVALMGAFTTMLVSFILPTAFFLASTWGRLPLVQTALCIGVLILGFAGMYIGLANTLSGES